jgi:hypothetical protein
MKPDLVSRIPNLWHCYQMSLHLDHVTERCPIDVSSQIAGEDGFEPAFPNDWAYLPILTLYNQTHSG